MWCLHKWSKWFFYKEENGSPIVIRSYKDNNKDSRPYKKEMIQFKFCEKCNKTKTKRIQI